MKQHIDTLGWHTQSWHTQGWIFFVGLNAVAIVACLGCGPASDIVAVHGVVQHDAAPLSDGKVLFTSMDGHKPVAGQIQTDGTFDLTSLSAGNGASPGRYLVTVVSELMLRGRKVEVSCIAPKNFSLTVEPDQENDFVINVSEADGWKLLIDD